MCLPMVPPYIHQTLLHQLQMPACQLLPFSCTRHAWPAFSVAPGSPPSCATQLSPMLP